MADKEASRPTLVDELASLSPKARRELLTTLIRLSETFAEVPDCGHTAHTLGLLATGSTPTDRR